MCLDEKYFGNKYVYEKSFQLYHGSFIRWVNRIRYAHVKRNRSKCFSMMIVSAVRHCLEEIELSVTARDKFL